MLQKNQDLIEFAYNNLNLRIIKGHEEYENMISGIPYDTSDHLLECARQEAHQMARNYCALSYKGKTPQQFNDMRQEFLCNMLGKVLGKLTIEAPFSVEMGFNISIGRNFYSNFNLVLIDTSIIEIGDDVKIGPNVVVCTATHSINASDRLSQKNEISNRIIIGNKVWIGANVTVLPGVSIGDGVVVGANSVVNKDLPPYTVCIGTPARVLRKIEI